MSELQRGNLTCQSLMTTWAVSSALLTGSQINPDSISALVRMALETYVLCDVGEGGQQGHADGRFCTHQAGQDAAE
jgi:hypothetical protein